MTKVKVFLVKKLFFIYLILLFFKYAIVNLWYCITLKKYRNDKKKNYCKGSNL